ncbi:MAG: asparaginase [Candidatus Zixiibacteriota bacterium]
MIVQEHGRQDQVKTDHSGLAPAVEVTRGEAIESIHHAAAAVVDCEGNLIAHLGDPGFVTFSRSSLKPFQALAGVRRGVPDRFGFQERHLALVCASHSGEPRHVEAAREMLAAIGARPEDLQCGVHIPLYIHPEEPPIPPKTDFTPLHNNCSGKHSGMLALARVLNAPIDHYLELDSPVQKAIRETVIEMLSLSANEIRTGTDGCSAPNYAVSLRALAAGYARLSQAANPRLGRSPAGAEGARIVAAMMRHPEMISGTGRLDLAISEASGGTLFTKAGGEAVECVGVPERGLGIAIKVGDGGTRAVGPLLIGVLRELGLLPDGSAAGLNGFAAPILHNHRGIAIGTARYVGRLIRD